MGKQLPVPDVEALRYKGTKDKPDIKIFVSHRIDQDSVVIDNPLYIPVRCGAVYDKRKNIDILGDDTGDTISEKREKYGELTVQYWVWKNVKADYYGLCHYRRYLAFSEADNCSRNESGQVEVSCFNHSVLKKYKIIDPKFIEETVKKEKLICGERFDINKKKTPRGYMHTVLDHWKAWDGYIIEKDVINKVKSIIKEKEPMYLEAFDCYMHQNMCLGYNCFILEKNSFFELCRFQFGIIFELEKQVDTSLYNKDMLRTFGFVGEMLYGTFVTYLEMQKNNISYRPILYAEYTKKPEKLLPFKKENNILIVLMSSNEYVPYVAVFLQSLVSHASPEYYYDIVILEKKINDENKKKLGNIASDNISIRFYNPCYIVGTANFYIAHEVYAEEAYYRMLTPWILEDYDKAIVMDSDIIVKNDPALLYNEDVGDYYAAGVADIAFQGILRTTVPGTYEYCVNEMKMNDPFKYINTGVLVMNLKKWRDNFTIKYILQLANTKKFRIQEQDILNVLLEDKIKYLNIKWNFYVPVSEFLNNSINCAPYAGYQEYKEAGENPFFIHYAGVPKPWNDPSILMGNEWWKYARQTDYYEVLLTKLPNNAVTNLSNEVGELFYRLPFVESRVAQIPESVFDARSSTRKKLDRFFPQGTKRYKFASALAPSGSKRLKAIKKVYHLFVPYR